MIRKSLFWGLTLVLAVALVSLIIRGRQMEKQLQSAKPAEVFQQSQSSPIRVLHPDDLQIVNSTMQFDNQHAAMHEIEVRNNGNVPYGGIQFSFVYLDNAGRVRLTKTDSVNNITIQPGQSHTATNVRIAGIPSSVTKFQVTILSADMLPSAAGNSD